ncbi:hypothetical protein llg_42420 [Luteolibacter sp. LG18]|nr:hypothetical protein llg_42420 [Luteolibacter sp. LG18]
MALRRALGTFILSAVCGSVAAADAPTGRPRVIVTTDLSNEPDDEESLVRFLVYANEFDVEALIASTSIHLKEGTREDLLHRDIDAYGAVVSNLSKHAPGYPAAESLHSVCRTGQTGYGMAFVGDGKGTPGSKRIIEVVDRADDRPVWVCVWGGANTLAQALWEVKATRPQEEVDRFIGKLRVYTISDQDDAGYWIRPTFPSLFYICSPGGVGGNYWESTWSGISGDRLNKIGVMHRFEMVDNPWLKEHIHSKGPLGALYPPLAYLMEGDTPSFLGLINNGLGWHVRPDYGGWGGRYQEGTPYGEKRRLWTSGRDARDTVTSDDNGRTETSIHATVWRWREHFQNDFSARMDWSITDDFKKANHNPIAVLNGDKTKNVIELSAKAGETVTLSAEGTSDPDGDAVGMRWWVYEEAGEWSLRTRSFSGDVKLTQDKGPVTSFVVPPLPTKGKPPVAQPASVHVILEVRDAGAPNLWSYRRAIIKATP